ncbi:MAG: hypothetical protein HKO59_15695 [Phycisphaerales bacterium]|nr:hypothetical protein [Phycisphaerales bacterium]
MLHRLLTVGAILGCALTATGQSAFVNWESPHVNPITLTPDGARVLAVNTADNRLEVFAVRGATLVHEHSIPVGLDPVSVRARTATEAWVVNHVSDSVSVVDLATMNVRRTILTGDEPTDVVFAGDPERAFVSISQLNQVAVYDPADLAAAPIVKAIKGEDPRALATDGERVYVAIFESGNNTTILDQFEVSDAVNPYPGDPNPPPNAGAGFEPPIAAGLPVAPEVGLIVRKDDTGAWIDDNGGDWSPAVPWDLLDHDLAVIDAATLDVSYVTGTMNLNMNLAVAPTGDVLVVGTEAFNEIRFEPNLQGRFGTVMAAGVPAGGAIPTMLVDLNPHLDYTVPTIPQTERDLSLGDPRGVAWRGDGSAAYVTGMGSNNLLVLSPALDRIGLVEVGEGPTGVAVNDAAELLYVLDKFEGAISVVDADGLTEIDRVPFYDPTPAAIKNGRPHLYDTHRTSGLGHLSCASCHIDGRMDQVAWDLGDPSGSVQAFDQVCNFGLGGCEDWHPMKGPMTTQTLVGIIGTEPLHWRGDRNALADFNGAFESLMGDDTQLTGGEMNQFKAFVATLTYPPNPYRNLDGSLPTELFTGGDPANGETLYTQIAFDQGALRCSDCHALPTGTNGELTSALLLQESQSFKIPQLRNMHEKTGFDRTSLTNHRGFGFVHDGSTSSLFDFLQADVFTFASGPAGDQQRRDIEAFLFAFATDTHAGIGAQVTVDGTDAEAIARRDALLAVADGGDVGLVAKGLYLGLERGFAYLGAGLFESDREGEIFATVTLDVFAAPGAEMTYTIVPLGSETRIGLDRDEDGFFDRDEIDACTDPADPASFPGGGPTECDCPADIDGSGDVGFTDLLQVLSVWGVCGGCPEDLDGSGDVGFTDLLQVLSQWGPCS